MGSQCWEECQSTLPCERRSLHTVIMSQLQLLFCAVIIFLKQGGYHSVHIERIAGPEVVQSGSELMLDCNYSYLDEEESQLDLKWYFNGSPIPVYQWVPSMSKGPQVIGELFKHRLDLDYVAHNDTYKKHRALRVVKSDHRFSGTYQCKVSSFVDEDFTQKAVLVFNPPEKIVITPERVSIKEEEHLNISCAVTGVYPVPIIDLSWSNNASTHNMERLDTLVKTSSSGLLDVTVSSRVSRDVFSPDVVIACDVPLPNTDFYVREELHPYQTSRLRSRYTSSCERTSQLSVLSLLSLLSLTIIYS